MTIGNLWLPSLGAPSIVNPVRASTVAGPTATLTTITTTSLTVSANDLLIGAGFSSGVPRFNTYAWSGGETNNNIGSNATGFCSVSNNYAIGSAGGTTFNFTTTASQTLGAIFVDLIPANSGIAPTFNATSVANGTDGSAVGSRNITLGSYTTVAGDCIVAAFSGQNADNSEVLIGSGAGATWTTIQESSFSNPPAMFMLVGYNCAAGQTSFTASIAGGIGTDNFHWVVAVFSGVAT